MYKEYEVQIWIMQVQWLQPKIKLLVRYNIDEADEVGGVPPPSKVGKMLPTCVKFNELQKSYKKPLTSQYDLFFIFVEQGGNIAHRSYYW